MPAISLANVQELSPAELCNFIQFEYYTEIKELRQSVHEYISSGGVYNVAGDHQLELLGVLFMRLEAATMQMMENDEAVIFPLICKNELKKGCGSTKLPVETIHQLDVKVITLLEELRHIMNNYLPEADWEQASTETTNQLFRFEQQLQQSIHIKETLLLYKIKDGFNQTCAGNCKVDKN